MPNLTEHAARSAAVENDATTATPALSNLVRERTRAAHRCAESRPFIVALMRGEFSLSAYADYAAQLVPLYQALEARPARAGDPALLDPRLARADALRNDLRHLGSPSPAMLPSAEAYAAHLRGVDADDLPRYLAHHYTRYLGDLSGGQAIATLVARYYGATDDQLSYYRFDGIAAVPFKRAYREGLDALGFDENETARFLAEAEAAFAFTADIFDELGERWEAAGASVGALPIAV